MTCRIAFGPFEFCGDTGELRKSGVRVRLSPQSAALLTLLIEHHGGAVGRKQILSRLWPGAEASEASVTSAVNRLRSALCDRHAAARYVETLPGSAYRFIAPFRVVEELARAPLPEPAPTPEVSEPKGVWGVLRDLLTRRGTERVR